MLKFEEPVKKNAQERIANVLVLRQEEALSEILV